MAWKTMNAYKIWIIKCVTYNKFFSDRKITDKCGRVNCEEKNVFQLTTRVTLPIFIKCYLKLGDFR